MSIRIGCIGDLHGHDTWKKFVNENPTLDKYVFIGDYVDNVNGTNESIWNNLADVIEFKKSQPDKVELLIGNHDVQYIFDGKYQCSGYRPHALQGLKILFGDNKDLFQMAYQYKNYLFTHAGVSNKWYNKHIQEFLDFHSKYLAGEFILANVFNAMYETNYREILFEPSNARSRFKTEGRYGGIIWADKSETREDYLDGYHQIVGHSFVDSITTVSYKDSSITYTDCLGEKEEFYILEIE